MSNTHKIYSQKLSDKEKLTAWSEITADFVSSGLKQVDYAKQHGLKAEQLSYYYNKFYKPKNNIGGFKPIEIKPAINEMIKITTPSGYKICIPSKISEANSSFINKILKVCLC